MPNLVSMLSSGLIAGVPKIQAAVNLVAKPLAVIGHPAAAGASGPVAAPAAGGGGTTIINNISVSALTRNRRDLEDVASVIEEHLSKKLRGSGNHVTWTSGGKQ
jgi:hypothetical protein